MDERRALVLLAQAGDARAFSALVRARRSALLVLLAATVGDWDEAEDALQEALWRAFTRLRTLRDPAGFDAWLRRVALNVARDHLRARLARWRREGEPAGSGADLERLLAATDVADTGPADDDACAELLHAIGALPPLARRAGRLAWVAGVPRGQVAALLGVSVESVHAALHRGRDRLSAMFYAKGDWRRDVAVVPAGVVRVAGYPEVGAMLTQLRRARPDLRTTAVDPHADAELKIRLFWTEAPARSPEPPAPAEALPLDGLADAAGFELDPFGDRLARFTIGGRPYWLPHHDTAHLFLYNADLLQQAGLPLPRSDWTWDEFFGYCRRCRAAGLHPINMLGPGVWEVALVAEQLGATRDRLDPVRDAVAFVRDWQRQGWAAPYEVPDWALGHFLSGRCVFFILQFGHEPGQFTDPRFRPFRWGVVPVPRFRRDDPPVRYWFHCAAEVHGKGADPAAAFKVLQGIFTHGPVAPGDDLPAYRTPEAMREWMARPLPLGKECVLELAAATDPLYEPEHFVAVPGAIEALDAMLEGTVGAAEGIERMRLGVERYRAGERVAFSD